MCISLKLSFCQLKFFYNLEVNLKANLLNTVLHFKPLKITTFKPLVCIQHIAANFDKFGKSSLIHQTKIIQISTYIRFNNLLAESIYSFAKLFLPNAQNE